MSTKISIDSPDLFQRELIFDLIAALYKGASPETQQAVAHLLADRDSFLSEKMSLNNHRINWMQTTNASSNTFTEPDYASQTRAMQCKPILDAVKTRITA